MLFELWQIFFGIAGISTVLALSMSFNKKSRGSVFRLHGNRHGEVRLSDSEPRYDYQNSNPSSQSGKFDHLFGYGINKEAVGHESISEARRKAGERQITEARLNDTSGLTSTQDIPKLNEYRGEFDGSAQKTGLSESIWSGRPNNAPSQKPKEKDNSWTPMAFFNKD